MTTEMEIEVWKHFGTSNEQSLNDWSALLVREDILDLDRGTESTHAAMSYAINTNRVDDAGLWVTRCSADDGETRWLGIFHIVKTDIGFEIADSIQLDQGSNVMNLTTWPPKVKP